MDERGQSPVVMASGDDPAMDRAMARARATFKYLWRELTWEYRRIVPGLQIAAIKAAFSDTDGADAQVEHIWLTDVRFNGETIVATLMNSPNHVRSVARGDEVRLRPDQLEDWMYVIGGRVYGGFTVQALRAAMPASERRAHDDAWGFRFPEPDRVDLVPDWDAPDRPGLLARLFGGKPAPRPEPDPEAEHPMSQNMAHGFGKAIDEDPDGFLRRCDEDGLTTLHSLALGGSAACVQVLLEKGADAHAKTRAGHTALDLAEQMGWSRVAQLLRRAAGAN